MRSHIKFFSLFTFVFFASLIVFPLNRVSAVTMNPSSGAYVPGAQLSITVTAAPTGAGSNAVAIRLSLTNASVVSFTPVTGGSWVGQTQDCAGPSYFTATTVCASLAKSVPIVSGETLGTLVIQFSNSPGIASIERTSGNAYSDGLSTFPSTGNAATFTISSSGSSGGLPNTAITDPQGLLIVSVSVLLVATGFVLIKLKPLNQD